MRAMLRAALAGAIVVAAAGLAVPASAQPAGSYLQSCANVHFEGPRLVADCQDRRGRYHRTAIDHRRCVGDVWNDNGRLACRTVQAGPRRGPPPYYGDRNPAWGGGQGSITLYNNRGYRGRSVTFDGPVPNLANLGFNDRADSVNVRGRWRTWQLCDDAGFRGRCVVVRGDVPDLRATGLAGRVSSLRPVN